MDATLSTLGGRVSAAIAEENTGTPQQRRAAIEARAFQAQNIARARRRAARRAVIRRALRLGRA